MSTKRAIVLGIVLVLLYLVSLSPRMLGCHEGASLTDPGCARCLSCVASKTPLRPEELHSACWSPSARRLEVPSGPDGCTVQVLESDEAGVRTMELAVLEGEPSLELTPRGDDPGALVVELEPVRTGDRLVVRRAGATLRVRCSGAASCRLRID